MDGRRYLQELAARVHVAPLFQAGEVQRSRPRPPAGGATVSTIGSAASVLKRLWSARFAAAPKFLIKVFSPALIFAWQRDSPRRAVRLRRAPHLTVAAPGCARGSFGR